MDLLDRRQFDLRVGQFLLTAAVAATLPMVGCDWIGFLIRYIPVINGGIGTINQFFGAALPLGVGAILLGVQGALADIQTACVDYQNAPPTDKATFLGKIETFLKGVVDGFQSVLDVFGNSGPVPGLVLGVINIVISTLQWLVGKFMSKVPKNLRHYSNGLATIRTLTGPARFTYRTERETQYMDITPVAREGWQFRDAINALMAANGRSDIRMPN